MQLRVPLGDIPEDGLEVAESFTAEQVRPAGAEVLPVSRASIAGELTLMGEEALFRGTLEGVFSQACDRCLEPMELPFEIEVAWFFEQPGEGGDDVEDEDVCLMDGDIVDLGKYAWEEMALAMPLRFVHPDDQPCGFRDRLAQQQVDEENTGQTSPFAKLKELFPEGGDEKKE